MNRYIDADALMEHIESESRRWGDEYDAYQILSDIEDFPTFDVVERKHATDKGYENSYGWVDVCSLCGCEFTTSQGANYCPHCGAKLDDEEYEQEIIDARKGEE